ncbi:MAG: hypothetical protein DLM54_00720 [Acidimicrobiales bacterium]|nr:MAG: hypothetical protein DLM54_00720 [Acidimicrobiales bacterium]
MPAGTTCDLFGVTVTGSVIVQPGAIFGAFNSTIDGSVLFNGSGGVSGLCGSTVKGGVTVENLTSNHSVTLGSDEAPRFGFTCSGDHIAGPVTVTNNAGQVEIVGSTVYLAGNSGTGVDSSDGSVGIEGDTFHSNLICFGNNPAPANDDPTTMPNTVQGQAVGQCAALGASAPTG